MGNHNQHPIVVVQEPLTASESNPSPGGSWVPSSSRASGCPNKACASSRRAPFGRLAVRSFFVRALHPECRDLAAKWRHRSPQCIHLLHQQCLPTLSQRHAVFVGYFGFCMNAVAFFHRRPQAFVTQHYGIDYAIRVESKLILAKVRRTSSAVRRFPFEVRVRRSSSA